MSRMGYHSKLRSPIGVFFLAMITAGIYYLYWFYKVNEEAAILTGDENAHPGLSLLATTLGAILIVPYFWTHWTTATRVGEATGQKSGIVAKLVFAILLAPFAALFYTWWLQGKMNKAGRMQRTAAMAPAAA